MKKLFTEYLGITLIELVVAIAVVGILSTVAYPYYNDSVMKSRRIDAINTLLQLQMAQEKYRMHNPSYANDLSKLPARRVNGDFVSIEGLYKIDIVETDIDKFKISAIPLTGGLQENDSCKVFEITQNGPLTKSNNALHCWNL